MPVSRKDGWKIALAVPGTEEVLWFNKPAVFLHGQFLTKVHDKEEAMTFRVSSIENPAAGKLCNPDQFCLSLRIFDLWYNINCYKFPNPK